MRLAAVLPSDILKVMAELNKITVLVLLAAFILHPLIHHHHPEAFFGTGIESAAHSDEKKIYALSLAFMAFFAGILALMRLLRSALPVAGFVLRLVVAPSDEFVFSGTMHPKLYA